MAVSCAGEPYVRDTHADIVGNNWVLSPDFSLEHLADDWRNIADFLRVSRYRRHVAWASADNIERGQMAQAQRFPLAIDQPRSQTAIDRSRRFRDHYDPDHGPGARCSTAVNLLG